MLQNILFQINACFFLTLFIKESWKKNYTTVFNINK